MALSGNALITFDNVSLGYNRLTVLRGLNFTLWKGDFLGIVGPNGAGKTTILRAILGILKPRTGRITFFADDHPVRIGYVPQRGTLDEIFPFTVQEVVVMGRYGRLATGRRPRREDYRVLSEVLQHLGIADLANTPYRELSGGQKQRALIARALAGQPNLLILDEPTGGMDLSSQKAILDLIRDLHQKEGLTIILVSHLLNEVATYVLRLALLDRNFFQIGPTGEILREDHLGRLYGIRVRVGSFAQQKIIVAGE